MSNTIKERVASGGPKRILSLDGGGVMGLISLGYLERIETVLKARQPEDQREGFRLSQYFDLIGGTSTGAIIATLLALGWKAEEIRALYLELCPKVFKRGGWTVRNLLSRLALTPKFDPEIFSSEIDNAFAEVAERAGVKPSELTLGSEEIQTGLAIATKRIDTSSVWVQTNVPGRRFWDKDDRSWWPKGGEFISNREYPLKTIVQASASAPYYLEETTLDVLETTPGVFVDGGVSPHNNPSKELFLMAALQPRDGAARNPFGLGWKTGADQLMLISIGTGMFKDRIELEAFHKLGTIGKALRALRSVIHDASQDAVTWLQALSEPVDPWTINGKLETMAGLRLVDEPLLHFQRFQTRLELGALSTLMGEDWTAANATPRKLKRMREFDNPDKTNLVRLRDVGVKAAAAQVRDAHFPAAFDI